MKLTASDLSRVTMAQKNTPPSSAQQPGTPAFVQSLSLETAGIIQVIPEGLARKDKIISMIINDLRSPLSALSGLLNLLVRDPEHTLLPDQAALAQQTLSITKSLIQSSERLFHFYGASTFGLTPSSRFLHARQLVQEILREAQPLAQWHEVRLENEVADEMRLFVDPVLMQEVLLELLTNAIRACQPRGRVVLSASSQGGTDTLRVQDDGIGIPPSSQSMLFTEGATLTERATTVNERRKRGTGLGLPLSARIVQAHGGTLSVESVERTGTVMTIRLPTTRPRILVVDDQKMDLDLLTLYLDPLNVAVVQAKSGPQAIVALADGGRNMQRGGGGFDLVISDINMPGMDGFALLEQIVADPHTASIPVILLTGEESMAQRVKGFRMGASDFVLKPVNADDFRLSVRRLIGCMPEG
ncbi:MAG: hybrid sensor histidine kinase/response regulator [Magnetococcales bacterium]|nr:hybrid sensor histidine kinase/response regulator [Magnetococcales bacterium]